MESRKGCLVGNILGYLIMDVGRWIEDIKCRCWIETGDTKSPQHHSSSHLRHPLLLRLLLRDQ